jgi:SP family general alpha glucoside:H+ symporter-like MFS transporter
LEGAKVSVLRLTSVREVEFDVDKYVSLMALTTEHEREMNGQTSYLACFKGTDLRRTIIVIGCYCMQVLSGSTLRAYVTYFFEQAGLSTDQSFNMSIVAYALGLIGEVVAVSLCESTPPSLKDVLSNVFILQWLLMPHVGRRTLFLWGLTGVCCIFLVVGGLGVPQGTSPTPALAWSIGGLLLASVFISDMTVGPVSYSLVVEIPSSVRRSKSVVIARFTYAALNIVANVVTPYQLNPSAWGWGAKSGFFWAGTCFLGLIFTYFWIPEPKDRTTAELDLLFERKVATRKFPRTQVHVAEVTAGNRLG